MQIGVIGDIHGAWDDIDTAFFNAAGYDALLFVGDFARIAHSRPVARRLASLQVPAWAIPGNHDAINLAQLIAEIKNRPLATRWGALGMQRRVARLARDLGSITLGGYSRHRLAPGLGLIIARPHAMGGDRLYFRPYLKRAFGIASLTESRDRLCALIDTAPRDLIVLAHNGPAGLGTTADAPFGCDFDPELGDFGDRDLAEAIAHARATGHRVRAVFAGHMHHQSKHSGEWRQTAARRDETLYINAARVPRIEADGRRRHHIRLQIDAEQCRAETIWTDNTGRIVEHTPIEPNNV
ncbi:metallophosphoesterase [Salinisphaera sp. SPP-AMP-43]|uniref:metallophosphoesterase n=1 Tax=Salinisphaera sp. SPP-AMP-43 TaxID=3121288 RepID=UPI003C6E524B